MTSVLTRVTQGRLIDRRERGSVNMEVEGGVVEPQAKEP